MPEANESDIRENKYGYIKFHLLEAAAHSKAFCWGLCCVQGCIWGILGMIYFFVFLPSGFLLIMYGTNKQLIWATVTGAILLVLSTFGVPALCVCIRWYRRKRRDRRQEYRVERTKAVAKQTYENPVSEDPDVQIVSVTSRIEAS